jgi:two-component system, NtrC family, nitrogen regulation sensor histidine kinase NtrY
MATAILKPSARSFAAVAAVTVLLLTALYLMSDATQNSAHFGRLYSYLLVLNVLGLVLLLALITRNLLQLWSRYRRRAAGSRLTVRLVITFISLAIAPLSVVYYFSLQFLQRGIDSWFDVRVESALKDALELGRSALDTRMREALKQTEAMAAELEDVPDNSATLTLDELRGRSEAYELTLLTERGRVIASSSAEPAHIVPSRPHETVLLQLRQGHTYAGLDLLSEAGLQVRVVVPIPGPQPGPESRIMQALFPVPERTNTLADSVQSAYAHYKELAYLRQPLKFSFILTLSLVLLLSLLAAVWAAIFAARRLVAPIGDLAQATRAVAAGNYDTRLPVTSKDDLGFLVQSFNEMTRDLALARDEAKRSHQQEERQRAYLEAILAHLSSGVLTVDTDHVIRTVNAAAGQILDVTLADHTGVSLEDLIAANPHLQPLAEVVFPHLAGAAQDWRAEVSLFGGQRQVLMCRGSPLPGVAEMPAGHVIVFDDVTTLIQVQRNAAWGEVARRLAHEIKNPLTPIQLSAERLRHKYLKQMPRQDSEVLDRLTHTIIQQVMVMKEMVNAFSEYARSPQIQMQHLSLNTLVNEVLDLYRGHETSVQLETRLEPNLPAIEADPGRLRQLLHNLIKNSLEAVEHREPGTLSVTSRCVAGPHCPFVELRVEDNGPGIPSSILGHLFEPYVTTKPKGSGLGLAIVKKIVEEHGGTIWAENLAGGGASVVIRFAIKHAEVQNGPHARPKEAAT